MFHCTVYRAWCGKWECDVSVTSLLIETNTSLLASSIAYTSILHDRNENMRISSGGNSIGHIHHDVIFCNKGCDWWINKSCALYLCLFATIRLIKEIYKTYYGVRSMNHFYFDEFINILIIHQFEQARVCSKRFKSVRSTSDSHHLLIL